MITRSSYKKICQILIILCFIVAKNTSFGGICKYRMKIPIENKLYEIPYCSSNNISKNLDNIQHAVIVIHGTNRNADDYYNYLKEAAKLANDSKTIIVAPQFLIKEDVDSNSLSSKTLYWSNGGWKQGNKSQSKGRISSFAVIDKIVEQLKSSSSNLNAVTITGHSAGGQFTNRYAAGADINELYPSIIFRYVPANPSSYLYFSPHRVFPGTVNYFYYPFNTNCSDYDDYKYGIKKLYKTGYMNDVGGDILAYRYQNRFVTYILGNNDTTNNGNLDTSCPATTQGQNRYQRGRIYYNYLGFFFGNDIYNRHGIIVVSGIGHDAENIYQSETVFNYIFNWI